MQIGSPVWTTSLQGETMRGRYLAFSRTETVDQPNRTDIAAGVPEAEARRFRATRTFGLILFLHNGRLFQQERNMAFVWPDPRLELGNPIEGLDAAGGKPLAIHDLIEAAMQQQRVTAGGTDGTAVEIVATPEPAAEPKPAKA